MTYDNQKKNLPHFANTVSHRSLSSVSAEMADLLEKRGNTVHWSLQVKSIKSKWQRSVQSSYDLGGLHIWNNFWSLYQEETKVEPFYSASVTMRKRMELLNSVIKPYDTYQTLTDGQSKQ